MKKPRQAKIQMIMVLGPAAADVEKGEMKESEFTLEQLLTWRAHDFEARSLRIAIAAFRPFMPMTLPPG